METTLIISLLTLIALEVVLGIDNIIFISILAGKLPPEQQRKARTWGLLLAMLMRLGLLAAISVIMKLDRILFTVQGIGFSGKALILVLGGLFLIWKSSKEIWYKMEGEHGDQERKIRKTSFANIIGQILLLDLVFSVDSIITAVGLVEDIRVMYAAVIITVIIMLVAAGPISGFVNRHPAFKVLALSFLLLIGFALLVEGFGIHIPKGYVYFAMAFALLVDVIQMKVSSKLSRPVQLHEHYPAGDEGQPVKD